MDYIPKDYLIIDESHVSVPQIKGMFGGDQSRKQNLVDYGFRLSISMDNRPLNLMNLNHIQNQTFLYSATPADLKLNRYKVSLNRLLDQLDFL